MFRFIHSARLPALRVIGSHRVIRNRGSVFLPPFLFVASAIGNVVLCESNDNSRESVNSDDTDIIETFMEAVRKGDVKKINHMISQGFDVRSRDSESWNALHWATEMGQKNLVLFLLDRDPILLNMKTKEGLSAINIAAWRGDKDMVKILIEQGAEIDDRTKWGEVPLHHAVTFGYVDICNILLSNGADPFTEDRLKRTPFMIAMQKGSPEIKAVFDRYRPKSSE